jgi:hypothetical protein
MKSSKINCDDAFSWPLIPVLSSPLVAWAAGICVFEGIHKWWRLHGRKFQPVAQVYLVFDLNQIFGSMKLLKSLTHLPQHSNWLWDGANILIHRESLVSEVVRLCEVWSAIGILDSENGTIKRRGRRCYEVCISDFLTEFPSHRIRRDEVCPRPHKQTATGQHKWIVQFLLDRKSLKAIFYISYLAATHTTREWIFWIKKTWKCWNEKFISTWNLLNKL